RQLVPHGDTLCAHVAGTRPQAATVTLLRRVSEFYVEQGLYEKGMQLARRGLDESTTLFGGEHEDTLAATELVAFGFMVVGNLQEAESLFRVALAGRERVLGPDHYDTLKTCQLLGSAMMFLRRFEEAELLQERALAGFERLSGTDRD